MQSVRTLFSSRRRSACGIVLFTALYLALFALLRVPFSEPDDIMLSYIANGSLGGDRWQLLYPNPVFGAVLQPFYRLAPALNWYGIFLVCTMGACFAVWLVLAARRHAALPGALVVLCCAAVAMSYTTFTVASYISVITGTALLMDAALRRAAGTFRLCSGVALLVWGYAIRSSTLPSALFLFAGPVLIFLLMTTGSVRRWILYGASGALLAGGLLLLCNSSALFPTFLLLLLCLFARHWLKRFGDAAFLRFYDSFLIVFFLCLLLLGAKTCIEACTGWSDFRAYTRARAGVVDIPYVPYEQIASALDEIRISRNDYSMVLSWAFADKSVFSVQTLTEISDIMKAAYVPFIDLNGILQQLTGYKHLLALALPLAASLVCGVLTKRKSCGPALLSYAAYAGLILILLARERLVDRVMAPLCIGCALQSLLLLRDRERPARRQTAATLVSALAFCLLAAFQVQTFAKQPSVSAPNEIAQYTSSHSDQFFILDSGLYNTAYFSSGPLLSVTPTDSLRNVIKSGSGETFSPRQYEQMQDAGIQDPDRLLQALARQEDVFYIGFSADTWLVYLQEHVDANVTCQVMETFSNVASVYKFTQAAAQ